MKKIFFTALMVMSLALTGCSSQPFDGKVAAADRTYTYHNGYNEFTVDYSPIDLADTGGYQVVSYYDFGGNPDLSPYSQSDLSQSGAMNSLPLSYVMADDQKIGPSMLTLLNLDSFLAAMRNKGFALYQYDEFKHIELGNIAHAILEKYNTDPNSIDNIVIRLKKEDYIMNLSFHPDKGGILITLTMDSGSKMGLIPTVEHGCGVDDPNKRIVLGYCIIENLDMDLLN